MERWYWPSCNSLLLLTLLFGAPHVSSLETCDRTAQFKANNILLPQHAIEAGAEFLKKLTVNSLKSCYFHCCQLDACTTAIFKSKAPNDCFLFNCGHTNSCTYTEHEGYDVVTLSAKATSRTAALNEPCDQTRKCSTNHTVCSNGQCVCQSGWVKKGMECVHSICQSPNLQFQCEDASTCVAIYDRCNGIIECPDGSDEVDCVSPASDTKSSKVTHLSSNQSSDVSDMYRHVTPSMRHTEERPVSKNIPSLNELSELRKHLNKEPNDVMYDERSFTSRAPFEERRRTNLHPKALSNSVEEDEPLDRFAAYHRRKFRFPRRSLPVREDLSDWSEHQPYSHAYEPELHEPQQDFEEYPDRSGLHPHNRRKPTRFNLDRMRYSQKPLHSSELYSMHATPEHRRPSLDFQESLADREYRPHGYFPEDNIQEELIDPSVLDGLSTERWELSGLHSRAGRLHSTRKKIQDMGTRDTSELHSRLKVHANTEPGSATTQSPVSPMAATKSTVDNAADLAIPQRSQTEGHTAALILAFSLGLVCCFVGLVILEWRRRQRLRRWATGRRSNGVPVLFGDNGKLATMRNRSTRRSKHHIGNINTSMGTEEENKSLYDGLVL